MNKEEFAAEASPHLSALKKLQGTKHTLKATVIVRDTTCQPGESYIVTDEESLDPIKSEIEAYIERKRSCKSEQSSEQATATKEKEG